MVIPNLLPTLYQYGSGYREWKGHHLLELATLNLFCPPA